MGGIDLPSGVVASVEVRGEIGDARSEIRPRGHDLGGALWRVAGGILPPDHPRIHELARRALDRGAERPILRGIGVVAGGARGAPAPAAPLSAARALMRGWGGGGGGRPAAGATPAGPSPRSPRRRRRPSWAWGRLRSPRG